MNRTILPSKSSKTDGKPVFIADASGRVPPVVRPTPRRSGTLSEWIRGSAKSTNKVQTNASTQLSQPAKRAEAIARSINMNSTLPVRPTSSSTAKSRSNLSPGASTLQTRPVSLTRADTRRPSHTQLQRGGSFTKNDASKQRPSQVTQPRMGLERKVSRTRNLGGTERSAIKTTTEQSSLKLTDGTSDFAAAKVKSTTSLKHKKIAQADVELGKPYRGWTFYFDVEDMFTKDRLETEVKGLAGKMSISFSHEDPPTLFISDHDMAARVEKYSDPVKQLSAQIRNRTPLLYRQAWEARVPVKSVKSFTEEIRVLKQRVVTARREKNFGVVDETDGIRKECGVLTAPYVKLEILPQFERCGDRITKRHPVCHKPLVWELDQAELFETIYLGPYMGRSLFHKASDSEMATRREERQAHGLAIRADFINTRDGTCAEPNTAPEEAREKNPRRRRNSQKAIKQCEICRIKLEPGAAEQHFESAEHRQKLFVPGVFDKIDQYVGIREDFAELIKPPPGHPSLPKWKCEEVGIGTQVGTSDWIPDKMDIDNVSPTTTGSTMNPSVPLSHRAIINDGKPLDVRTLELCHELRGCMRKKKVLEVTDGATTVKQSRPPKRAVDVVKKFRAAVVVDMLAEHLYDRGLIENTTPDRRNSSYLNNSTASTSAEAESSEKTSRTKSERGPRDAKRRQANREKVQACVTRWSTKPKALPVPGAHPTEVISMELAERVAQCLESEGMAGVAYRSRSAQEKKEYMIGEVMRILGDQTTIDYSKYDDSSAHKATLLKEFAIAKRLIEPSIVFPLKKNHDVVVADETEEWDSHLESIA